ncbi:hypothetical protein [Streptomyces mirabilis]|nr:hypothetical protein [Streptomyces mirabilis]MCT9105285.1 hypothetical protein [Streptomyces mirabilis]
MSAPMTTLQVTSDDLYAATVELEQTGPAERVDQGGETVVLIPPATNYD